ncbi:hypothetical protein AZ78_1819 [Lysobacter capsici AZ78]|uniref:Uncharacterized protein n=1 Tax=Lysobacter capsici AZ78 TaxID=1444315 RepID=A0A108U816_9GAMM|nr:hypothetical protein AZ78_1819 [Lysobacter capsici AZ78]
MGVRPPALSDPEGRSSDAIATTCCDQPVADKTIRFAPRGHRRHSQTTPPPRGANFTVFSQAGWAYYRAEPAGATRPCQPA